MAIDDAKLYRITRDLDHLLDSRFGMGKAQRDTALTIRQLVADPRPADPAKQASRIAVLRREAADLSARLAVADRDVHALDQLVKACQRYVDDGAAAEAAATLAANLATTTGDQQ